MTTAGVSTLSIPALKAQSRYYTAHYMYISMIEVEAAALEMYGKPSLEVSMFDARQIGVGGWTAILSFVAASVYLIYWFVTNSKEKTTIKNEAQVMYFVV